MKIKRFALIMLALCLCISLAACSSKYDKYEELLLLLEDGEYQAAAEWIYKLSLEERGDTEETKPKDEISFVGEYWLFGDDGVVNFSLTADGFLLIDGKGPISYVTEYYESGESYMAIKEIDSDVFSRLEFSYDSTLKRCTGSAVGAEGQWLGQFYEADYMPATDLAKQLQGKWYYTNSDSVVDSLSISGDFTCSFQGKSYEWVVSGADSSWMQIYLIGESGKVGYAEISTRNAGQYYLYFQANGDGFGCYQNAMLCYLGDFRPFDHDRSNFYLYTDGSVSGDLSERWTISSMQEGVLQGSIYGPDSTEASHTFVLTMEGDYPRLVLTELADGSQHIYYRYSSGYDTQDTEYIYQTARYYLSRCLNGSSIRPEGYESSISGNEALAYVYSEFSRVIDYKDAAGYIGRFTVLSQQLNRIGYTYTDALGNTTDNSIAYYYYQPDGSYDYLYPYSSFTGMYMVLDDPLRPHGLELSSTHQAYYFDYNDDGTVSQINVKSGSTLYRQCTLVYDADGRVATVNSLSSSGTEMVYQLEYDAAGRLVKVSRTGVDTNPMVVTYSYNEDGTLAKMVKTESSSYIYTLTYGYTDGVRTTARYTYEYKNTYSGNVTRYDDYEYAYSYDENGRLTGINMHVNESSSSYHDRTIYFVYGDLYFYDAETE